MSIRNINNSSNSKIEISSPITGTFQHVGGSNGSGTITATLPSRDSLYEKHILAPPNGSSNLSFLNIFKIITALEKSNAIESEGLFRVNGNAETIRTLWLTLNNVNDSIPIETNHHDLAGLLKLYLRESRFPLIPIELFPNNTIPMKMDEIKDFIVSKLPSENVQILSYLLEYLEKVAQNSNINKMNPIAIGVCFGPNIVRSISTSGSGGGGQQQIQLSHIQLQCNLITSLIENRQYIFNQTEIPDVNNLLPLPPPPSEIDGDGSTTSTPSTTTDSLTTSGTTTTSGGYDEFLPPPPPSFVQTQNDQYDQEKAEVLAPYYDEFINLLTDHDGTPGQKSIIIERMTYLFTTDGDNFKSFLRDMGIDGIISVLEYILTLED
eukprot:gene9897-12140_t